MLKNIVRNKGKINLHNLFGTVWEMLLNLFVLKFEHLNAVWHCRLCCLGLVEEIDDFAIWESLFDILVAKINYGVPIAKSFTPNAVAENDFFFAI
jgi:hypothetical protein